MNIIESNKEKERISLHSHISGLGLDEDGFVHDADLDEPQQIHKKSEQNGNITNGKLTNGENIHDNQYNEMSNMNGDNNIDASSNEGEEGKDKIKSLYNCKGMVGQKKAREAAGIFINLIKEKNICKCLLLAGPSGSGKTAIAIAISKEISEESIPFCIFNASQVYSCEVKKTEILTQYIRKSIGVKIKEIKEVFEGEVMKLEPFYDDTYDEKKISYVHITLKTLKEQKKIKIHSSIYENILKEKIQEKDVIYIESHSGLVKRVGRCSLYQDMFDIETDTFVDLPKGNVHKKKNIIQNVTLYDLDISNVQPKDNILNFFQNAKCKKTEITDKLRNEINKIVYKYVDQGIAQIVPGVLFIDEVHMLDIECFTYLNRTLESNLAPIVILATNRGICNIKGTNIISAHGIPVDLLDRIIIVKTMLYNKEEILQVLKLRCKFENIKIENEALNYLADIGMSCSLRYAIQLLTPAKILSKRKGKKMISKSIIEIVSSIFFDTKRSTQLLLSEKNKYLY
ncbi:RuvB-like helicase 1, putative [Plasmodium chabaudi chabaudi]|uniref:RuvB-like helicase n=1 Tax=Plasmodium chabaudi chabaudi TaxID=31271 RepID=A0A4V0KCT7_PLACU|nr:RuvB-like helicase 1, putative [Plasmodium chabaudi chabaudi]VTZ70973.1 RuvB-like helicase 1, putative [Plasmodium chabaudi chabaudi]|eukprot:XP_016654928.1 RuvB-like helicase 1, putative [Plasmodium chabaudi chabaudi]